MQSETCVNHLLDNHDNCWVEICWKVQNLKIRLADPNLIGYTQNQANALKEFLKKYTKLPQKQSLITTIRTSMNEAFNYIKLNYTDKKINFAKSFSARHGLAVLHNNNSFLEMLEVIRRAGILPEFSEQDLINIGKIWKQRQDKRNCNIAEINKRNVLQSKKIAETKKQIEEFDFSKDLIPYEITIKDNIINQEFRPLFANLISDFDRFIHCEGCKYFPKQSPKGGLCRLCYFYNEYGLASYIINPKFHNNHSDQEAVPIELIDSIIKNFFRFNNYREFQQKSIESFLKNQDTLTILPTGTSKTLIFSIVSILTKALTVVFTLLKAVMECQLRELVEMGISATKIYTALDQSLEEQEKIFSEIAVGITRVLWVIPEKFIESPRFHRFLCNVSQTRGIQFVVDECHCILEFEHFRLVLYKFFSKKKTNKNIYKLAWTKLGQIKDEFPSSPILLLTATCSYEGATQLARILKRSNLNNIIEMIYKNIEQIHDGRAIIYSSTPNECIDILNGLKEYVGSNQLGMYHGKMQSMDQKLVLCLWNNRELKYIIATNAFGIGVHMPDVRIIIYTTFPLSPTNFVQEVRRAGRDRKQAESIVLYSCADIHEFADEMQTIQDSNNCLEKMKKNIFAMAYTFENFYWCYRKIVYEPFRWPEDFEISECGACDNCKRRIIDEVIWCDISKDLIRILDIVDQLLKFTNDPTTQIISFGCEDIVDVFMKAKKKC
ncbi:P-loop containing nucleoside triphosphate hydrolase protein [Gigaspora rosea]|uniref:DNA 3'-5' helicase n=1 Tax=Gigaspora rosea TaxID=44941 RepID=A0A397UQV7_9GLOM|nr:P-loop containing nucleoside triphosphate hydrolase protein [Gigaspora rosea]